MVDQANFDPDHPAPAKPVLQRPPSSILFLCNHNIIRSPMAERITRALFGGKVFVASAGVGEPQDADGFVQAVMAEKGWRIDDHEPRSVDDLDDTYFDLIITLTPSAHHVALERQSVDAVDVIYWPSVDPTVVTGTREARLDAYRELRDRLTVEIETLLGASDRPHGQTVHKAADNG